MVELIHDGKAEIIEDLKRFEPIDIGSIISELKKRSGQDLGGDVDQWCTWFLQSEDSASKQEKESFELIRKMKTRTDYYVDKLNKSDLE
jgi:hypothetical protein